MPFTPMSSKYSQGFATILRLASLLFLAVIMIAFPQNIFPAAKRGIEAWWHVVFPGLFPFFVVSELLIQFGAVHFLGVFLEPIMRPLFNVPGAGAFVLAAGYTSGAPIGGVLTSQLRQQNLINEEEAGRLIAFSNNASPLFMLSSIAVGFLGQPQVGWILASSHYAANLCVGVLLKHFSPNKIKPTTYHPSLNRLFISALEKMHQAYVAANKPLGRLLGDATRNSMQNMLVVGGFIIAFSVFIEILSLLGFLKMLSKAIGILFLPLGIEPALLLPLASGVLEMTIGIKMISESGAPLLQQLVCISLILGWAGTAVHAQVAAFISESKIRLGPYFLARGLQGLLAAVFTFILSHKIIPINSLEVLAPTYSSLGLVSSSIKIMLLILIGFLAVGIFYILLRNLLIPNK